MTQPRTLKYGRRPPKNAPALKLGPLLTGNVPPAPASVDYGKQSGLHWGMLLNDNYGTCVSATAGNTRAVVGKVLAGSNYYPTDDQVAAFYKTQNPNFPNGDNGMDIQTALEELNKNGDKYFDGKKIVAFAKVDYTNEAELRAAHAIFGQVWYGVNVQKANMDEFNQGQPWTFVKGSPDDGGHSITGVGYDPSDYRFITWAEETTWTEAFRTHQVEEAWVVIWPEHLGTVQFEDGIDQAQLADDYQAITGKPFPVVTPPPPAPPRPQPTPTPPGAAPFPGATDQVAAHIVRAAARARLDVTAWMNHHFDTYFGVNP